jgi:hypothetical protein
MEELIKMGDIEQAQIYFELSDKLYHIHNKTYEEN